MARRALVLSLLLLALVAPVARAQSGGAFDELTGSPTPTATPEDSGGGFSLSGNATLYLIAGGLLIAFGAVTYLIARDARSSARAVGRAQDGPGRREAASDPELRKAAGKAASARKVRARQKGRAQKAARRRNR